jgi:hypothetical protein
MKARGITACVLATGALLVGCQSTVTGNPVPQAGSPTAAPPPGVQVLTPKDGGYVFVETRSGKTRCQLNVEEVGCESSFTNAPVVNGVPANGIRLSAKGEAEFIVGNMGDVPAEKVDNRTYSAEGWTIVAAEDGIRFTNDATLHGMFLGTSGVEVY